MTAIRQPAVAGTFYPANPDILQHELATFMSVAATRIQASTLVPKAIIGPHAGYVYSGPVAASAYARLIPARGKISRVVLIGPSHHVAYRGLAVDTVDAWDTPLGRVPLDTEAIARLRQLPMVGTLDAAYAREHSLEVHVPFLQHVLGEFKLVPIVAGDAPPEAVAAVFDALWGGAETLFVVSTDLSHYLDYATCQRTDARTATAIEHFALDQIDVNDACGRVPTRGLLLAAKQRGMTIERLDLRNSGDTAGPKDRVVGYGAWVLTEGRPAETTDDAERAAVEAVGPAMHQLVRQSIACGLTTGKPAEVAVDGNLPPLLSAPGAAFVTLRLDGQLRGCIGSATAWRPLAVDVAQHAFNAAFRDTRFMPLRADEAPRLELSVSVLTPPVQMRFRDEADLLAQLRPGIDGLIIEDDGKRSLFLPSVWADVPDARQFLGHLKVKAGMTANYFSARFQASRFRSIEVKGRMVEAADYRMQAAYGHTYSASPAGWYRG